jgi:hypothetical protein
MQNQYFNFVHPVAALFPAAYQLIAFNQCFIETKSTD